MQQQTNPQPSTERSHHPDPYLTITEVRAMFRVGESTFRRIRSQGRFPPPDLASPKRWRESSIQAHLERTKTKNGASAPFVIPLKSPTFKPSRVS